MLRKKTDWCKMDIRPVFSKEIDFMISLKNCPDSTSVEPLRSGKEKSRREILPSPGRPDVRFAQVRKGTGRHGFLTAELLTATALLGLIIAGLAVSMNGFAKFNQHQWTRQRCTAAAQAQLDSISATGQPMDRRELKRLWPEVEVVVKTGPGEAPWDGLKLVQVTAAGYAGAREVTIHLARYVRTDH